MTRYVHVGMFFFVAEYTQSVIIRKGALVSCYVYVTRRIVFPQLQGVHVMLCVTQVTSRNKYIIELRTYMLSTTRFTRVIV